jgi:hypothetical protein
MAQEQTMAELVDMFVQVVEAGGGDRDRLRSHWERGAAQLDGADGWMSATAGITDEGRLVGVLHFASAEAAERAGRRPDRQAWWRELEGLARDGVAVDTCAATGRIAGGPPSEAGVVVVLRGRATDLTDVLHRLAETEESIIAGRPALLGGFVAAHADGEGFTEALYFRDEQALQGGGDPVETELSHVQELSGYVSQVRRLDLHDPWLHRPGDTAARDDASPPAPVSRRSPAPAATDRTTRPLAAAVERARDVVRALRGRLRAG